MHAPTGAVTLETGESVELASLYSRRPLALVFVRHFGCVFCRKMAAQLRRHPDWNVAIVGMSEPEAASKFRESMHLPHRIICDPKARLYEYFGIHRARLRELVSANVVMKGLGATLSGHMAGRPASDPWRLSGAFVIATDGEICWSHRARDAADNVRLAELAQALENA